ncbi:MAG TPA: hypothetical protein VK134_06760 [Ktedonobacteraceae bacterium]|nr:hypothetical protein [Ktedonobacteraceae bacterium]
MIQTQPVAANVQLDKRIFYTVIGLTVFETILVTLALVPPQEWTRLLPGSTSAALDGPFPAALAPIIPALLYLVPTLIGFLCRSWQRALLFATLPAWIGLALFVIAAASKVGAFNLVSSTQVTSNVSVLELFAALGGIGWLARHLFKLKF